MDGLRWDRLGYEMPALDKIAQNGVRAEWLDGVFVTKSAPSMFSIATGGYDQSILFRNVETKLSHFQSHHSFKGDSTLGCTRK